MREKNLSPAIYVTLGLRQKLPAEKVSFGNIIVRNMTNNSWFVQPVPSLISYQATINNLADANIAAAGGSLIDKQNLVVAESNFDRETGRMRDYVQNVAWANVSAVAREIIVSAGMTPRKAREKTPAPVSVSTLAAIFTNVPGTMLVKWKGVKYARTYVVYFSIANDMADTWTQAGVTPSRKFTVQGLTSGTRYNIKVVAVGVNGNSGASNIATCIAA